VRPFNVLFGWCGVDGSLLKPVSLAVAENIAEISKDLEPLIDRMQAVRMGNGFPGERTIPVFHATDSYGKHRHKLIKWYKKKFQSLRIGAAYATPRANAQGVSVLRDLQSPVPHLLTIVGDPQHDVITIRRLAKPAANDCSDFVHDHADMLNRLSAPPAPQLVAKEMPAMTLTHSARRLLQKAVQESAASFALAVSRPSLGLTVLKLFLAQPHVLHSPEWLQLFSSLPPRGVAYG
jgi:hypothetical protein